MYFTYKMHEALFFAYLLLVAAIAFLPSVGWIAKADDSQFSLIMAGLGFAWAFLCVIVHRGKAAHLENWEQLTAGHPFRDCPVYRYTEVHSPEGRWQLIESDQFTAPIRAFGLDFERIQQLLLAILLASYLGLLELVK